MRQKARVGFWAKVLDCFHCLSLWIALSFAWLLGRSYGERGLLWLALSAGAILLERLNDPPAPPPSLLYFEDEEVNDVLLRKPPSSGGESAR